MQPNVPNSKALEPSLAVNDLGPLAWVLDELRKSLEAASKALKRFVRDAEVARGSDLAALDASQLRIARQQLHQAVGALEMVGLPGPALVLRSMEAAVQKFIQQPDQCNQEAATKIERASFALTEYLGGVLADKPVSPVSLFPQYRDVQELVRADRIHPADLWPFEWRWLEPELSVTVEPRSYDDSARAVLDQSVLKLMKGKAPEAAESLMSLSLAFSAAQPEREPRIFWKIAAAYFEAVAHGLLGSDLYVRRAASRILLQYASLCKGNISVSDRLAQDLLFFCAQAVSSRATDTPALSAVRSAYGLNRFRPVDYELVQFGRFDPALLAQARKRITSAKETWSSLSAGDDNKFKSVADQFSLVTDSLLKLHAPSEPLAQALTRAVETTVRSLQPPRIELAMEVATSVLYLEAAFEDLDPNDPQLSVRTANLAQRLEGVRAGGEPQPLEAWMEELYRRVSDKQTMGSVVGELRVSLGELEKGLDVFFRNPQDKTALQAVPGQLSQMRGVLSVLGLDQASHAVLRMRESVEQMLLSELDEQSPKTTGSFEQLGNNLGALSFLIDMLNYQPALAKKLVVYDEVKGELKPLMGRAPNSATAVSALTVNAELLPQEVISVRHEGGIEDTPENLPNRLDVLATQAALADRPALAQTARDAAAAVSGTNPAVAATALTSLVSAMAQAPAVPDSKSESADFEEDDLRDIFLEEAREVVGNGREALALLSAEPGDVAQLTVLRRAFHTLKGSARMVGLNEFGEAAWSLEQLLNSWLADQKTATEEFMALTSESVNGFARWIADIAAGQDLSWAASSFRASADTMRTQGRYSPLSLPGLVLEDVAEAPLPAENEIELTNFVLDAGSEGLGGEPIPDNRLEAVEPALEFDSLFVSGADNTLSGSAASPAFAIDGIDFDSLSSLSSDFLGSSPAVGASPESTSNTASLPAELPSSLELSAAEFDSHFHTATLSPAATLSDDAEAEALLIDEQLAALQSAFQGAQPDLDSVQHIPAVRELDVGVFEESSAGALVADAAVDEQIKVIGSLRIGIPLYNVYLNEADEWSRRLVTEVAEWALERHQPVSDSTVALAHSLAGSSATVGFAALSDMARALEHALQQSRAHHSNGAAKYGQVFVDAAEDIRRLLHQFAAGFLKDADEDVLEGLRQLDFLDSVSPSSSEAEEYNEFADFDFSTEAMPVGDSRSEAPGAADGGNFALGVDTGEASSISTGPVAVAPIVPAVKLSAPVYATSASIAPAAVPVDADDEIDAVDAIDPDLFPIFEEEAAELMPQLGGALRQWSSRPDNRGARMEVLRALHTLKGSARLAGAMRLGEMAHHIESEIEFLGSDAAASQEFEPLLNRFDAMQNVFDDLRKADALAAAGGDFVPPPAASPVVAAPAAVLSSPVVPVTTLPVFAAVASLATPVVEKVTVPSGGEVDLGGSRKMVVPAPQGLAMRAVRQAATASIRVRSQLLDRMVNQAGEVMITRSRLEAELGQLRGSLNDMSSNLNRLRQQLRDIELQAETQMQSRLAQAKEAQAGFDPLEFDRFTRVQELTRMMAESVNDVATVQRTLQRTVEATEDDLIAQARQTRELQRDLLRTRMVEFEGISERLYRVVRQASKDTGKQVRLDLLGGTTEMDRGMLDRMTPAFEHLLRNCVAHGIESPQGRADAGKEAVGLITVHLRQEGNDVSVDFSDDGAGLNLARIREKALSAGLIAPGQVLDDQDAANLIFMPGFTTATQVTELSGRGIGMDVVRSEVNSLGGRIETSTVAGKGTHFRLVLPLTTAVTQVVMIRAGNLSIGVPANVVENVRRASAKELQQAYNSGMMDVAGEAVPFFWSGALLQASQQSAETHARATPVVIFRSAAQRVALHVDEVLGNQEVVVKNLGPQLSRLPGLAGMSVLASGAVVLIYNPVALASIYGALARGWSADSAEPHMLEAQGGGGASRAVAIAPTAVVQIPLILVVDDSITVRRVTQRLLQREGYRVAMAADGLQALERLQEERPAVVLSDIEMPRMDGFDLARNIRADVRLNSLPIIMITSRIAEKHREHAKELGVDHYLGKPYSEEELMSLVRHYCAAETAVSA